jgi:hypothetical protein
MDEYLLSYLTEVADDPEGWAFVPITVAYALVDTGFAKMKEDLGLVAALSLSDEGRALIEERAA